MSDISERHFIVFTEAVQLPAGQRAAYLDRACAGDGILRWHVEKLLTAHLNAGQFLSEIPEPVKAQSRLVTWVGEKPGDRIGRYKLLQQIGEGGCGIVFLAEQDEPIRRRVALKIIKPGMDTKSVIARFEAERQALALMEHPNIAKIFDAGATETGRPFFVMELVRGTKITDYCDQNSLPTKDRLDLFVQVCQAVQHAHQKGVIHRDIKPSNILVATSHAGTPLPVVIDFGIAKATSNQPLTDKTLFTAFEMFVGTPVYMSPEQAALTGADVDTRSDIYSLGVLLYELLTGRTPFDTVELLKAGFDEIRRILKEQEPLSPSNRLTKMSVADLTTVAQNRRSEPPALIRAVRGELDWIVIKAMEKDRTRRYETATGLALDVKSFLANEPVSAHSPGTFYKFRKSVVRHKLLYSSIALIVGLFLASLVTVSASLARERQARRQAGAALQQAEADKLKAQTETAKAQIEAAKSLQITGFLEQMLKGVGPSVALGRDTVMLHQILDQTTVQIGRQMENQPEVEAEVRGLIGSVYFDLQDYPMAEQMQRAALVLNQKLYGAKSKEVAASLNDLGVSLWKEGNQPEAESLLREALAIRQRYFGKDKVDEATSLLNLANVYQQYGRTNEAESLAQQSLLIREGLNDNQGSERLDVADSLRVLGILYGDEGNWLKSEATLQKVLSIRRKRLGPEHPLIADSLNDVAWAAEHLNKINEVETTQREAVQMQRKLLGDGHPAFMDSLHHLCATLEGDGKYGEAELLRREALRTWDQKAGIDSPEALYDTEGLVRDQAAEKDFGGAEESLANALNPAFVSQSSSGDLLNMRVELMARQGRWQQAASDAKMVLQYQPTDSYNYHRLAGLLAITGDRPGYEQLCQKIITQFSGATDPYVAERMAQDCLLLPESGVDLQIVDKLADTSVASEKSGGSLPFSEACKAMSNYRLARYPEAIVWAEKALRSSLIHAQAKACAVMAMADWHLGRQTEAGEMLARGNSLAPEILSGHGADEPGESWIGWLFARVSLDEAAALVQPPLSNGQEPHSVKPVH
jgi:serine/threonine protein kinase/tetratricopeptide (TPR) repeat protein